MPINSRQSTTTKKSNHRNCNKEVYKTHLISHQMRRRWSGPSATHSKSNLSVRPRCNDANLRERKLSNVVSLKVKASENEHSHLEVLEIVLQQLLAARALGTCNKPAFRAKHNTTKHNSTVTHQTLWDYQRVRSALQRLCQHQSDRPSQRQATVSREINKTM